MRQQAIDLSIILPVYNEEETLPFLFKRLEQIENTITKNLEIIFVNDGSKDNSLAILKKAAVQNKNYKIIDFSRNFGHQMAITCGLAQASGKAAIVMDADLQDPPELIADIFGKWRAGADIVIAKREKRAGETWIKKITAWAFYRMLALMTDVPIVLDAGDFYLLDRKVYDIINACPERSRFLRGLVAWAGFKTEIIKYSRAAREHGKTNYTFKMMTQLARDALFGFSAKPIFAIHCLTVFALLGSFCAMMYALFAFISNWTVPGWTTLIILVSLFGGLILFSLGIIGEYIYRIFKETQNRPGYLIREKIEHE